MNVIAHRRVVVYTDGACSGNPGPGGWGALILFEGQKQEYYGGEIDTTNNKMELRAVIEALKTLSPSDSIDLYTDSMYVKNGITLWIKKWRTNGWRTTDKKPVKNLELWQELDALTANLNVTWCWVKAHSGNQYNEEVDLLSRKKIQELIDR